MRKKMFHYAVLQVFYLLLFYPASRLFRKQSGYYFQYKLECYSNAAWGVKILWLHTAFEELQSVKIF